MRSLLRLRLCALGLIILYFALANRGSVKISLDPFPGGEASNLSFEAPLFLVFLTATAWGDRRRIVLLASSCSSSARRQAGARRGGQGEERA